MNGRDRTGVSRVDGALPPRHLSAMSDPSRLLPIPEGAELLAALERALAGGEGWVQAVGTVQDATLRLAAAGGDEQHELRGHATLLALNGPVGGPYMATLARATGVGIEVVGGVLTRARARVVNAVLTPIVGVSSDKGEDSVDRPREAGAPPASPWAALAASSAAAAREEEEPSVEELEHPAPGDRVQHFAFGLCDVLMVDGDSLRIRDVRGVGRVREIRIDKLELVAPIHRDGKRVFKLLRRG